MKRTLPLLITSLGGLVLIASVFFPAAEGWGETATLWFNILAAVAFILGGGNLLKVHLKAISDRKAGWGYSAVILVSFLATLAVGLAKVGVKPDVERQWPGETWVSLPAEALPTFVESVEVDVLAALPATGGLPASVRGRIEAVTSPPGLALRGWMSASQRGDLLGVSKDVRWKCAIERLAEKAQLPEPVRPFLMYRPEHDVLVATRALKVEDAELADAVNPDNAAWTSAGEALKEASRRETVVTLPAGAEPVALPQDIPLVYDQEARTLTLLGPMSPAVKARVLQGGGLSRPVVPLAAQEVAAKVASLGELSDEQRELTTRAYAEPWSADELILVVDGAGAEVKQPRTWCEIAADVEAGNRQPELETVVAETNLLNDEQKAALRQVVEAGGATAEAVNAALLDAGPLPDRQAAAVTAFFDALPREADRGRDVAMDLLRAGPLSAAARDSLLNPYRKVRAWRGAVESLSVRSQQVKHPWSGKYDKTGSAFWWVYEYLFKPLTATMFAMLAFYIASAAFRAFRAKNLEAGLLLGTALIILLGRTYVGVWLTSGLPDSLDWLRVENLTVFIMKVFNTAGNRAIMIGIALGIVSTSLKILLGVDRSYLGE